MTEFHRPEDATNPQPGYPPPAPPHPGAPVSGGPTTGAPVSGTPTTVAGPSVWQPPHAAQPSYGPTASYATTPSYGPQPHYEPQTQAYPQQPQPARHTGGGGRAVGLLVAAALIALCSGLAGGLVGHQLDRTGVTTPSTPHTAAPVIDRSSLANIAEHVQPSVVDINTGQGEGSGVIFTKDGSILTNNHVVEGAQAGSLQVTFSDGKTARAVVAGTDPAGDLAVIKAQGVSGLVPATFANSDDLRVGDTVLALGSPLGLQGSVTAGIVSALHRTIDEGGGNGPARSIADAIQTDAAINPGNSGGALVDTAGEVVGINTAIATAGQSQGSVGVGFAIASNRAKATADQLVKGGKVIHPVLGVQVNDADGGGALIADVVAGGPAEKAGLQRGDVVVKAGSHIVNTSSDLVGAVQSGKPGDQLALTIRRNGTEQNITVTLGQG
jgi:putative serine protease PepD